LCQKSGDRPTDISFGLGLASMPLVGFKAMLASVELLNRKVARKSAGSRYGTGKRPSQVLTKDVSASGTKAERINDHRSGSGL